MALFKVGEFAKHCGKQPGHVSTAVARGRLIKSGKYIDTKIPENKLVMDEWRSKMSDTERKNHPELEEMPPGYLAPITVSNSPPAIESRESPEPPTTSSLSVLNLEKTRGDIEWKRQKTVETELKNAKLRGENIPTDMVLDVISLLGHSFQTSYEAAAQSFLMEFSHKLKIAHEMESELSGKLVESINSAHNSAINEAKKAIKSIVLTVSSVEMKQTDQDDTETD